MRLLQSNDVSEFSLTKDLHDNIPRYAILSHTWGADAEEATFRDLMDGTGKDKAGYDKIRFCGEQARREGIHNFWVDTCCIDKSNHSELVEAITSMFRWYQNAAICYVYLSDVSTTDHDQVDSSSQSWHLDFRTSRWFTRGWTLQELIAPQSVVFFCSNGNRLGDRKSLERLLHEITGIAVSALRGTSLSIFNEIERWSWAEHRNTKRAEDKAYSLLGIFDISMPLLYGEGADNAFRRLREELHKRAMKRNLDDLSTISPPTSNSTKRLKSLQSHPSSIPSDCNLNFLDPKPPYSEHSVHSEHSPETGKELVTGVDATTKQSLIDQLYFTKIDERLTSLTAAQGTTCRWFLTTPQYASWNDLGQQADHSGFIWIRGKPGTGKSTLMKFLFEATKLNAKDDPSQITLSFFFLARGTVEEKSTTGLYRSLLHQLLEKVVELKDSLEWMTADGARAVERSGWHKEALKHTLTHAIKKLGSRLLTIFIDALDECDDNQATDMIGFFEELCDIAREAEVRLRICFSSRHYPTIEIQKGIKVTLEHEIGHTEDIQQYIKSKLKVGRIKEVETLRSDILETSSSIFLWVVLVVDILNAEYRNGSAATKIRDRLKDIPSELNDLFEMIITRDGENLDLLQICLKWVLFATRPLKPPELYFAIQISLDKECSGFWDQGDIDLDQIKIFVRSSSKGLAEVTRNKASEVQFIHESVRDFLLGKYKRQWSGASGNFVGCSHEILRDCCLAQLNASISQDVDISHPLPPASKAAQLRETINLKFPFLAYSVLNVLHHANSAQQNAMEQADFLAKFPLQQWKSLNNALERFEIRRYNDPVSMLYILAEKNLADLIQIHSQRESCFDVENGRYGPPIFAALATSSSEAVRVLFNIQADMQPSISTLHDLCKQYCQDRKNWANFGRDFHFSRKRVVSSYVAEYGDEILLSFLMESGKCIPDSKDKDGQTLLSRAAASGREGTVKLLLETGKVEVNSKDKDGRTPLWWAAERGREGTVKLLLETGKVEVDSKDKDGRTPLWWAAERGREGTVKLLLETGKVEVDLKDRSGRTPLWWAAERGHEGTVKLLLETGKVEVDLKDNYSRTPLSLAAEHGHEGTVKQLLGTGKVEVNLKDRSGRTPLLLAAEHGHEGTVKLLLETGKVEVNSKDNDSRTPLWCATSRGHERIVKLLLEIGKVEVELKDNHGRTPLWMAASYAHEGIVKLLLETGKVEVDLKDNNGNTPLTWAIQKQSVIKLFREYGN